MAPVMPLGPARLAPHHRVRLVLEVVAACARVEAVLRRRPRDLPAAVGRLRRQGAKPTVQDPRDGVEVGRRLGAAVMRTIAVLPGDARCLRRSLTLLVLMERRAIDAKLVLAVRPSPFAAHAWLEHSGVPLIPAAGHDYGRLLEL